MRIRYLLRGMLLLLIPVLSSGKALPALDLVPYPSQAMVSTGHFTFTGKTVFSVENEEQAAVASSFTSLFRKSAGFEPAVEIGGERGRVQFRADASFGEEAYLLRITPSVIQVRASGNAGFFYALQTLRQLLPVEIESPEPVSGIRWNVPCALIQDQPRFGYRGLMIDVARYFLPKENLLRIIDCASMLKINRLHLHLMDDNGWRIEIRKYPLLTEVGSRRVERERPFPERRNPRQGEPTVEKGFYTQEDIREIVAYAAARQIEVIPELEMPAHSNAALAAYPLLACPVVDKFIGVLPGLGGSHADIIYCAGNEKVFSFLEDIVDELVELFPSRYIHLGGDEAWKTYWKECPLCQERIRQEGLADEEALQGYFMSRMSRYVRSKGKEVIGWDELTETGIPEDAIIFGWRGKGQAALKAAAQGHRFVLTPAQVLYFIRYQGPQWFEPLTYFGNNRLKDVYTYEPVRKDWDENTRRLLMGVQASMWTEFCDEPEDVEYQIFPRLSALAEVGWTAPERKDWPRFVKAMDNHAARLSLKGVTYARSMYNIQHEALPENGNVMVALECERPDVQIRYTLDGTEPSCSSRLYTGRIPVSTSLTVKTATFRNGKQLGETLVLPIRWNKATARPLLGGRPQEKLMVNGVRGSLRHSDFEWCTWDRLDSVEFTIDLLRMEPLRTLVLGSITNYGMMVHKPASVHVYVSNDNRQFRHVSGKEFSATEIFREGPPFREDLVFDLGKETARYVKIRVTGPGKTPPTHLRPEQVSRFYFDEIIIE